MLMFASLPPTLCLVSINPTKNRYRFYRMTHQHTLWNEDVLVQTWGRMGTEGRSRLCFLEDADQAQALMAKLLRRRLQHGYAVTEQGRP
jgi:predicted DNA-binding WGR domain protein